MILFVKVLGFCEQLTGYFEHMNYKGEDLCVQTE